MSSAPNVKNVTIIDFKKLGRNLRFYKNKFRYTNGQIGYLLGVHELTPNNWHRGTVRISIDYLVALASLYGVTVDHLLFEEAYK